MQIDPTTSTVTKTSKSNQQKFKKNFSFRTLKYAFSQPVLLPMRKHVRVTPVQPKSKSLRNLLEDRKEDANSYDWLFTQDESKVVEAINRLFKNENLSWFSKIGLCTWELKSCNYDYKKSNFKAMNLLIETRWPDLLKLDPPATPHLLLGIAQSILSFAENGQTDKMNTFIKRISNQLIHPIAFAAVVLSQDRSFVKKIINPLIINDFKEQVDLKGSRTCVLRETKFSDSLLGFFQYTCPELNVFLDKFYKSMALHLLNDKKTDKIDRLKYPKIINSALDDLIKPASLKLFPEELRDIYRTLYLDVTAIKDTLFSENLITSLIFRITINPYLYESKKVIKEKSFTKDDMIQFIKILQKNSSSITENSEDTLTATIREKMQKLIRFIIRKDTHIAV